jgi:uncharacterized protein YodC (DUF2158 family)
MARVKAGDVVRLKSGGPKMTVVEVDVDGRVAICTWFDADGKLQGDRFPVEILRKAEPPSLGLQQPPPGIDSPISADDDP